MATTPCNPTAPTGGFTSADRFTLTHSRYCESRERVWVFLLRVPVTYGWKGDNNVANVGLKLRTAAGCVRLRTTSNPQGVATAYSMAGPSSGTVNSASTTFTVTPNGLYSGTITVTLSGGGLSGTLSNTWSSSSAAWAFTITPTATGTVTLTIAASPSLAGSTTWIYASNPSSGRTLLSASDFTYQGAYTFNMGNGANYCYGCTCRYVGGQLRFLVNSYNGAGDVSLVEFKLPAGGYGGTITSSQQTNSWSQANVFPTLLPGNPPHMGFWWEDLGGGTGRLWMTQGDDYPGNDFWGQPTWSSVNMTSAVAVCNLDSTGSGLVTNWQGMWGFQGVSQRCVMGNVAKNPDWFQSQYGVGPYLYGFGGYASRMSGGGGVSLGLFALAGPDVTGGTYSPLNPASWNATYLNGTGNDWTVPTSAFKLLADHRSGTSGTDWYNGGSGSPTTLDRGRRAGNIKNFFDGGGNGGPANGQYSDAYVENWYATNTPLAWPTGNWLSPAPDGYGRFCWSDTYGSTGLWIDGTNKYGLVTVASLAGTWGGYVNSRGGCGSNEAEIHVFDPAALGAAAGNTLNTWNVQPASMKTITSDLTAIGFGQTGATLGVIPTVGAVFDQSTKLLWLWIPALGGGPNCALAAYAVNC